MIGQRDVRILIGDLAMQASQFSRMLGLGSFASRSILGLALCLGLSTTVQVQAHPPTEIETDARCSHDANDHPVVNAGKLSCRAYVAIYVDANGNFLYMENVYQDPTRLIPILLAPPNTSGGCLGGPKCYVCPMPNHCGCVC